MSPNATLPLLLPSVAATSAIAAAPSTAIVTSAPATAPPDIGSDAWKELPDEQRHTQLRSLYNTVSLNSLHLSGVRGMLQQYLRHIAPLDRVPAKRGYGWRDTRFAGKELMQAWSDLLGKNYEPILCRVIEYADANDGMHIWAAADAIEEQRESVFRGKWEALLKSEEIKRFSKADERTPLLARFQSADFAADALACIVAAKAESKDEGVSDDAMEEVPVDPVFETDTPLAVPVSEGAVTRYLSLDPGLSCGFAIIQLNAAAQIVSIDVGVLEVDKSTCDDADRCINLQEQLRSILKPSPDHAFIEPFFGHGRQGDPISYMLRAAIMMELKDQRHHDRIEYTEVSSQTWKAAVAGKGVCAAAAKSAKASAEASGANEAAAKAAASVAEKAAAKTAIEQMTGFCFPTALYVDGKWSVDKKKIHDASDAAAIGLCGVKEQHASLTFAASLRVSAPGLPRPRIAKPLTSQSLTSLPMASAAASSSNAAIAVAPLVAAADDDDVSPATPAARTLHDPYQCTLVEGCTLRVNHRGLCQTGELCAQRSPSIDFRALNSGRGSKRPRHEG